MAINGRQDICEQYLLRFSGNFINRYYFPVFVPIGVIGNILSFVVRHILLRLLL